MSFDSQLASYQKYMSDTIYFRQGLYLLYLVTLSRATLHRLSIGSLQLVQHTRPEDSDVGVDRDHIKALLGTDTGIIAISTFTTVSHAKL